jgi:hypothetical protein
MGRTALRLAKLVSADRGLIVLATLFGVRAAAFCSPVLHVIGEQNTATYLRICGMPASASSRIFGVLQARHLHDRPHTLCQWQI